MPLFFLILALAVVFTFAPPVPQVVEFVRPSPTPQYHYTRGGVVQINPVTGATRFVPYRVAGELDRRRIGRA